MKKLVGVLLTVLFCIILLISCSESSSTELNELMEKVENNDDQMSQGQQTSFKQELRKKTTYTS